VAERCFAAAAFSGRKQRSEELPNQSPHFPSLMDFLILWKAYSSPERIISGLPVVRELHTSALSENVNTAFKKRPDDRNALPVCNAIRFNLN
jgi:hypothetical protein